jgi:DNA-binding transcriptional MerR regulator
LTFKLTRRYTVAVMSAYRISQLAGSTGFSPSTLRYYEQVGLLSAGRSGNGYRVYGEAEVARLRLVARARQLGLPLGDIRELISAWDGGRCERVKARLTELLDARSRAITRQIGELIAFDADLSSVRNGLAGATPAGPCDDGCGCIAGPDDAGHRGPALDTGTAAGGPSPASGSSPRPAGTGTPEIACTLAAADMDGRVREWADVLDRATGRREIDGGISLTFPSSPELAGRLADLAVREQRCCSFLTFAVLIAGSQWLTLEVRAPEQGRHLLAQVFGAG